MPAVDVAHVLGQRSLLGADRRGGIQTAIDEVIEARQLPQTDLAAEFVEPRDSALAVAKKIEGDNVDFAVDAWAKVEILHASATS